MATPQNSEQNNDKPQSQTQEDQPWWKLNENHKVAIGIVDGIVGGTRLIGNAVYMYKEREKNELAKERDTRNWKNWVQEAQRVTEEFYKDGPRTPFCWVLTYGTTIPQGAIVVGKEEDWLLHPCRAYIDSGIQLGKASRGFPKGCIVGYCKEEHNIEVYEVLVGDMKRLKWIKYRGKFKAQDLENGWKPVPGGKENEGTPLYVAKALRKGVEYPGKASEKLDGAFIAYHGKEKKVEEYHVLCYKESD